MKALLLTMPVPPSTARMPLPPFSLCVRVREIVCEREGAIYIYREREREE